MNRRLRVVMLLPCRQSACVISEKRIMRVVNNSGVFLLSLGD